MLVRCNHTHRFTKQFQDISQEDIASCPALEAVSPADALASGVAESIKQVIRELPYTGERAYTWMYIRPQLCSLTEPDRRAGTFYHLDVDAPFRSVAPDWDNFRTMVVSFGDVSETQFITDPISFESGPPRITDYVNLSGLVNNGHPWNTASPRPCQVAEYTTRDFHRAGPIRRSGWRLVMIIIETDAPPSPTWPPPGAYDV